MQKLTEDQRRECERLIPYARKIAGTFAPRDNDFESEAYLTLCESIAKHDPARGPLDQFIGVCIRNRMIRLCERRRMRPILEMDYCGNESHWLEQQPDVSPVAGDAVAALETLPLRQREIAAARWIYGRRLQDIATEWGISLRDVKRCLSDTRAALAAQLNDEERP